MSDDTKEPTSWFTIIPEFFYEVIGRIIPGGTFIFGLTYIINQTFLFDLIFKKQINGTAVKLSDILIFILLLGFSYSLGYFLTPFGHCLGKFFFKRQYNKKFKECSGEYKAWLMKKAEIENGIGENLCDKQFEKLFQCQHDQIRINRPELIRSLSKSQADVQLCINTSAAFFLIAIVIFLALRGIIPLPMGYNKILWTTKIHVCFLFSFGFLPVVNVIPPPNNSYCFLLAVGLIAFGFLFAACYRNKRFLERQFSFSKIAQEEEKEKIVG